MPECRRLNFYKNPLSGISPLSLQFLAAISRLGPGGQYLCRILLIPAILSSCPFLDEPPHGLPLPRPQEQEVHARRPGGNVYLVLLKLGRKLELLPILQPAGGAVDGEGGLLGLKAAELEVEGVGGGVWEDGNGCRPCTISSAIGSATIGGKIPAYPFGYAIYQRAVYVTKPSGYEKGVIKGFDS